MRFICPSGWRDDMSKPTRYFIRTVSPIHIGCDEVYEPIGFVIDEERAKLIAFDPLDFFKNLGPKEQSTLIEISKKGTIDSLFELYRFMREKRYPGHEVELCKGFVNHYRESLRLQDRRRMQNELNKMAIFRTTFNPITNQPYIPGSSIKGSFRTAYLNHVRKIKNVPKRDGRDAAKQLERALLDGGAFATDPFSMVKVSDFEPVGPVTTRIVYAVNEKKKISKFEARGPYQILEIIEPGALFSGWITVEEPHQIAEIRHPATWQTINQSLRQFYEKEKNREDQELTQVSIAPLKITGNSDSLFRIGRHSGAESVTIEGHRNIRIMKGQGEKPQNADHATTLWLAAEESKPQTRGELKPFGWVILGELSGSMAAKIHEMEISWEKEQQNIDTNNRYKPSKGTLPEKPLQSPRKQELLIWPKATIGWRANDQTITAVWENKKATTKNNNLVPQVLLQRLLKSKSSTASVTVERYGNAFMIVEIKEQEG
jgi:CRISPR-associated protein Csm5